MLKIMFFFSCTQNIFQTILYFFPFDVSRKFRNVLYPISNLGSKKTPFWVNMCNHHRDNDFRVI